MRYTPTLKLSTRLTAFITVMVISAMFVLFVGGTLSFKRVGQEYLNNSLESLVSVIDKELANKSTADNIDIWLPKLLQSNHITELIVTSDEGHLYHFRDEQPTIEKSRLISKQYSLEKSQGITLEMMVLPPYLESGYSLSTLSSISLAVAIVILFLIQGVRWLKRQLKGSELLEERGRMLLAGRVEEHAKGDEQEWPYTASQALDVLIEELRDARQERSRFDTFIRSHTFLDQLTGAANRVLFDSKLESALQESGATGGMMLFRINDWDNAYENSEKTIADEFIIEVGRIISNIAQRFPDVVFSRYYESDFAVLIPHQTEKDISVLANQCIRQLEKIKPIEPLEKDNWCHIGITYYSEGERRGHILGEAETALKSAQLQNINTWSRFQKKVKSSDSRGTVRWRTLFDKSFQKEDLLIFEQPCYLIDPKTNETSFLHSELFSRINDDGVGILKASRFMAAVELVGYEMQLDRLVFKTIFKQLKESQLLSCYSINMNVLPFKDKNHFRWLRDELLQLTSEMRQSLSFEFTEGTLVKHLDFMRPVVKMISGSGCTVIVGQAGRTITSTHYIKDLNVDYLKLHRSLVKKIEQRQENQLFIRSIVGACDKSKTKVIAVGVETGREWRALVELGVDGGQGRLFQVEKQIIPKPEAPLVQIGRRNRWRKKY
ncbi:RNase E specificity factor CsrD [Vibrio hannami]|uniref:RNase E specificity factor CsrD n=1 Tax=Vibrio hannami TaxID=2717094 RepID=UPI00240ED8FC|nr:RNase E specificity factor CsrD [Vibrio hannami]MDG3084803.1 RNase E specificity factor CsrD [Vibrio hannami]